MGTNPDNLTPKGIPINKELTSRWSSYLTEGLNKDIKEELKKKWAIPDNCINLNAPKVNPEIELLLSGSESTKDSIFSHIQSEMGLGLSALGSALNKILDNDLSNVKVDILPGLLDCAKYIAQAHFLLTQHRRHQIYPKLSASMQKIAKECQPDQMLFSQDFTDKCKSATNVHKSSLEMKSSSRIPSKIQINSKNNLNWKRPFTKTRFKTAQNYHHAKGQRRRGQEPQQWYHKQQKWNQGRPYGNNR